MSAIREKSESERPLILGLSATLIKGFPKKSISDSLRKLENTFNAKILTDEELNDIVR